MLNDYLNGYKDKLSRGSMGKMTGEGGLDPSEIKIDQTNFNKVLKDVEKKTYNPYQHYLEDKKITTDMNMKILQNENPKHMNQHLK